MPRILITSALLWFAAPAFANIGIDPGGPPGWKFHDLTHETRLQDGLKGAIATLMRPDDRLSTVFVYAAEYAEAERLGANTEDWKKIVIADSLDHGGTVKKEVTFKVDGRWRYYILSEVKTSYGDKTDIATMALVKDGHLIVFTFQQDSVFFTKKRLKGVVDLYFNLKIDKT